MSNYREKLFGKTENVLLIWVHGLVLAHDGVCRWVQGTGILSQAFPQVASQQKPVSIATDPPDPV